MKILAIDANSILNRAFYGIKLLSTASGEYTNAVYGFLSTYFRVLDEESPDAVCACFDVKGPTYRHMEYAQYKAGRRPPAPEFLSQIPLIKQILGYMGVACYELPGYEADDLLGTISRVCEETEGCSGYEGLKRAFHWFQDENLRVNSHVRGDRFALFNQKLTEFCGADIDAYMLSHFNKNDWNATIANASDKGVQQTDNNGKPNGTWIITEDIEPVEENNE